MTLAVVTRIHEWAEQGHPDPGEERRAWADAAFHAALEGANDFTLPVKDQRAKQRKRPKISGSSYKYCARQLWYKARGNPSREVFFDSKLGWAVGWTHDAWVKRIAILSGLPVLGPLPNGDEYRCTLTVDGKEYHGHIDLLLVEGIGLHHSYDEIKAAADAGMPLYPIDIKSLNGFTYDEWKHGKSNGRGKPRGPAGPTNEWGYLAQLNFYMAALGCRRGGFVASSKLKGELRQYEVERDDLLIAEIEGAIRAAETFDQPPPRPAWAEPFIRPQLGCAELQTRCGYCDFNTTACFPGFEEQTVSGRKLFRGPIPPKNENQEND